MTGVLRADLDVGLLTNVRMGVEIATGLAFLTRRRLALPFDQPVPPAPRSSIEPADQGRPATVLDLLELPIEVVQPDEWDELGDVSTEVVEWGPAGETVCVCDADVADDDPQLADFANGRTRLLRPPASDADVVDVRGRLLSFPSYFFHARPATHRRLHALLRGIRPRRPFVALGAHIAADLGTYNAMHLRRSDLTIGIPAYGDVTATDVADNVAAIFPTDEPLVVCSEVDGRDPLFDPVRARFSTVVFANDVILGEHRRGFFDLPRHEDNALGLVTQEVASRAARFVGTIGSTFTGMIQRNRLARDPNERFRFTADFTPDGPTFRDGEFVEVADGAYSWNRIGYAMSPDVLAWFREWPEAA
ncbi:MAG: O-fucosyltransferase family protein [Actinomycetota bacterium]